MTKTLASATVVARRQLGSHDAIIGAVEHGLGVSLIPASLVEPAPGQPPRHPSLRMSRVRDAKLRQTVSVVPGEPFEARDRRAEVQKRLRTV
jgi:DNA-binding transcriptional LysR family regulator